MNPNAEQLYRETLLAHSKQPHNHRELPEAAKATVRNPLCGDEITVYQNDGHITFTAKACRICIASASMMTQHLVTLPEADAQAYAQSFVSSFKDKSDSLPLPGDLAALSGVWAFPSRLRCATLPFEAYLQLQG